jgi:short-subunit dehydrogenase
MESKYALITGATSGIGYHLAKKFAENKYNLVIVARDENQLNNTSQELQQQYGVEVITLSRDLFDVDNAFDVYNVLQLKNIQIDVLVNDAGQGIYGEFVDTDIHRELNIIQLNISSLVVLTKLFLNDMVERGDGKILNVASVASKLPGPWQSVYHGTKAFVLSFSEAIRQEVKDKGVVVTALMPGATDTEIFDKADMLDSKVVAEGKLDDPAKVAEDGYNALMKNDDKVISGFKNKAQVTMTNLMPDETVAAQMHKQQAPVNGKK